MSTETLSNDSVVMPDALGIPGLAFRYFRGASDFPKMVAVLEGSKAADLLEEVDTVETMTRSYSNLKNCDPYKDAVLAEVDGQVVGYKRVTWWEELDGSHIYGHFFFLLPEWRGKGIEGTFLRHSESRLREVAEGHEQRGTPLLDTFAYETQHVFVELLLDEGYRTIRHSFDMARPDLEDIPEASLPDGIEVRPVKPEQHRAIWEAEVEAFKDHWGESTYDESDYVRFLEQPYFQPHLWQVAWEGEQVVGMIRNFVNEEENAKYGRKRGYTENISVRRAWRRRGVARALLASSFRLLKELGMSQAALGVDTENPNGALQLYESMGFRVVRRSSSYRKPL